MRFLTLVDEHNRRGLATGVRRSFKADDVVDVLEAAFARYGAAAFDTGAGVLSNLFIGADPQQNNPNPYTSYLFDITALAGGGGTFGIRFSEVDNTFFFNMGVDNVSIIEVIPEPASMTLLGLGLAGLAFRRRRKVA